MSVENTSALNRKRWSVIVLVTGWDVVANSTRLLERFSDTSNPGYFIVKLALLILALLVLAEGVIELFRPAHARRPQ